MREILFRGKRLLNREWVYGFYISKIDPILDISGCFIVAQHDKESFVTWYKVDPDTAGQYTGLTDKNGVKIFKGDIVKAGGLDGDYWFEVRYGICGGTQNVLHEVGYMGFYLELASKATKECSSFGLRNDIVYWVKKKEGVEVIGNIHDNPELLEGGSDETD